MTPAAQGDSGRFAADLCNDSYGKYCCFGRHISQSHWAVGYVCCPAAKNITARMKERK